MCVYSVNDERSEEAHMGCVINKMREKEKQAK